MQADIWRPSSELVADAKAAMARGDKAVACRLAFAATMHASTRGDSNSKYALPEGKIEEAMRLFTSVTSEVDFESITALVNEEIASDKERPSTGFGASLATQLGEQRNQDILPMPQPLSELAPGARVRIQGVSSRPELNGATGMILSHDGDADRYAVKVDDSGESVRVLTRRVVALGDPPAGQSEGAPDDSAPRGGAPDCAALVDAAAAGKLKLLKKLVAKGGDVRGVAHGRGGRPLSAAAAKGHLACVKFLLAQGADIDAANSYGSRALHDAAYHGAVDVVRVLCARGAVVDVADANGNTPLVAACAAGHVGVVDELLVVGAKVVPSAHGANRSGAHTNQATIAARLQAAELPASSVEENVHQQLPPAFAAKANVRLSGLVSRGDLNGTAATVLAGPTDGRFSVQVVRTGEKVRVRPDNLTAITDAKGSACGAGVDPSTLPSWPGLSCGATVMAALGGEKSSALAWCFQSAIPSGVKGAFMGGGSEARAQADQFLSALDTGALDPKTRRRLQQAIYGSIGRSPKDVAPEVQWLYSLGHLVSEYERHPQAFRFVLSEDHRKDAALEGSPCLVLDVLGPALACPAQVDAHRTSWGACAGQTAGSAASEPLLAVRYKRLGPHRNDAARVKEVALLAGPFACPVARAAIESKGRGKVGHEVGPEACITVFAESAAEIEAALAHLDANSKLLAPSYVEHFYAKSQHHDRTGRAKFRCSFVVPPSEAMLYDREASAEPPQHDDSGEPSAYQHDDGRASVLFSLLPPSELVGQYNVTVSHQTGRSHVHGGRSVDDAKRIEAVAPRNAHGRREFDVKVQPPLQGYPNGGGPCGYACREAATSSGMPWAAMVYDERRTFEAYLPLDTPGIEALLRRVREEGPRGGIKGFFKARREGDHLRIYADRILSPPAW